MPNAQVTATFTANTSGYVSNVNQAADATQRLVQATGSAASHLNVMKIAAGSAVGMLAVQGINKAVGMMKNLVGGSFQAASRVEELNVAMEAIGKSTGKGGDSIRRAAADIKKMGIETASAQQIAIQFAQANLEMADASKVARTAQDLAVVAGLNSTDTTNRLIQAIITGNSELLRQAGIAKTASQAYEEYAQATGKSVHGLTALEKQQAMTNMILKEGEKVAGTYEASMNSAGKVMRSFPRLFNDIQVAIGSVLSASFGPLVIAFYHLVKEIDKAVSAGGAFGPALQVLKEIFIGMVQPIVNVVNAMTSFMQDPERMRALGEQLRQIMETLRGLAPEIGIAAAALLTFGAAIPVIKGVQHAIDAAREGQRLFNLEVLINPYVAAAAAIIAAIAAIAIAFKYVYDRSAELRKSVDALMKQFQNAAAVLSTDVMNALKSIGLVSGEAGDKTMSFADAMKTVVDLLSKGFVAYIQAVSKQFEVYAHAARLVIKELEIVWKVIQMVAGVLKALFVFAITDAGNKLKWLLARLGPVGDMLMTVGQNIKNFFAGIPAAVQAFVKNIGPWFESFVNSAIDGLNKLIAAYNAFSPQDIAPIARFTWADLGMGAGVDPRITQGGWAPGQAAQKWSDALDSYQSKAQETAAIDPVAGASKGSDKASKALDKFKEKLDALRAVMDQGKEAMQSIMALYDRGPFDLPGANGGRQPMSSPILDAFGTKGDINSAISMYKQLSQGVTQYYNSLIAAAKMAKDTVKAQQFAAMRDQELAYLKEHTQGVIDLMFQIEQVNKGLEDELKRHQAAMDSINAKFDALDREAQAAMAAIEAKWQGVLDRLQKQLDTANEAYQRENQILQALISARDGLLKQISDGFRSFASDMNLSEGDLVANMADRLKQIQQYVSNVKALAAAGLDKGFLRQIIEAGPAGGGGMAAALVAGGADAIAQVNALQDQLTSEIASFGEFASQQYYDIAIAQQQAIVAPLEATVAALQQQIVNANLARAGEIAAMQAHMAMLAQMRAEALAEEQRQHDENMKALTKKLTELQDSLTLAAQGVQDHFATLGISMPKMLGEVGTAAIDSFVRAIANNGGRVEEAARNLARRAKAAFQAEFDMNSPSKVMIDMGNQIANGLIIGMQQSIPMVESAARNMAQSAMPPMPSFDYAAGGGGGSVVVSPGAVQVSLTGSMDGLSAEEIQRVVDQSLMNLAREIRRT